MQNSSHLSFKTPSLSILAHGLLFILWELEEMHQYPMRLGKAFKVYFPFPWWVPVPQIFQEKDWHDFVLLFLQLLWHFFKEPKAVSMLAGLWMNSCAQSSDVPIVAPKSCLTQVGTRYLPAHRRGDSGHEQNSAAQKVLKLNSEGPAELGLSSSWTRAKCLDLGA